MENKELEQVQEVAEVAEVTGTNNLIKIGVGVGALALVGVVGFLVYRKIKARKMATVDTVEYSEVPEEETEE